MKMCLRPCQAATTHDAYMEESQRVREFLESRGASLLRLLEQDREQAAERLEFERAAEIHKRLEKVKTALDLPDLACDLERLHGIVIQRSATAHAVELFPVYRGYLLPESQFSLAQSGSLDARVREAIASWQLEPHGKRWEQIALLARWFYRGTRKGEFVGFDDYGKPPYRRITNAIGRVARDEGTGEVVVN
jgi:hypothetical protein